MVQNLNIAINRGFIFPKLFVWQLSRELSEMILPWQVSDQKLRDYETFLIDDYYLEYEAIHRVSFIVPWFFNPLVLCFIAVVNMHKYMHKTHITASQTAALIKKMLNSKVKAHYLHFSSLILQYQKIRTRQSVSPGRVRQKYLINSIWERVTSDKPYRVKQTVGF